MELFTIMFLAFVASTGMPIGQPIKSQIAVQEDACAASIEEDGPRIKAQIEAEKGFQVIIIGFCIPEERKA